jgi:glycosyltransferase involved in cell wall biosynthesis
MFSWESLYSIKVGGIAPHVSELSEALAKRGHEVHVFTRRGDFDAYDRINEVHYQRVDFDKSGSLIEEMDRMSVAMYERFLKTQNVFGKFDIVHGHDWHPVLALNLIKMDQAIPYVLTVHSTEWGRNGNNPGNAEISHREWLGGYESSRLIVTTRRMQDELKSVYSIPESKIRIVPNGIVSGKVRKSLDPVRVKKRYSINSLASVVLFCGRMCYQKGPDLLIEAVPYVLRERQNVRFIFMGEGDMSSYCERRARELGVADVCHFLGYIPSAEKQELMNACDLVCVPSRNEPFGMIVLEAWDAGKPVVATEAVSIIRNFEDGLLAFIQPESIAWCINQLLKSPEEMKKLAETGQNRIEQEFSWSRIAEKTEEVHADILGLNQGEKMQAVKSKSQSKKTHKI